MPTPWQRDLESDRTRILEWIAGKLPDVESLRMSELAAPQSSGFSNDTLLFDLEFERAGRPESEALVVRIQPTGFQVFPMSLSQPSKSNFLEKLGKMLRWSGWMLGVVQVLFCDI